MLPSVVSLPMRTELTRRSLIVSTVTASVAVVGPTTVAAQEDGTETTTGADTGGQTHVVDMTDELVFAPDSLTVVPGDTVRWENVGQIGHSVTAYEEDQPEGVAYWASGGFDAEADARAGCPTRGDVAGGETYEHTFETVGEFPCF